MKVYRPTRHLLADVECSLAANRPSAHHYPLEDVIDLLCRGRHYAWVGIFLAAGEGASQQSLGAGRDVTEVALPEARSKILISIKLPSRELGVLSVESEREGAFGAEDWVLLERVADSLARFLTGRGKYLARKARTNASRLVMQARGSGSCFLMNEASCLRPYSVPSEIGRSLVSVQPDPIQRRRTRVSDPHRPTLNQPDFAASS